MRSKSKYGKSKQRSKAKQRRAARRTKTRRKSGKSRSQLKKSLPKIANVNSHEKSTGQQLQPNLVISQKVRNEENAQLKHASSPTPHFLTTDIKFELQTQGMPGIEDMRGQANEMDAGKSSLPVLLKQPFVYYIHI